MIEEINSLIEVEKDNILIKSFLNSVNLVWNDFFK